MYVLGIHAKHDAAACLLKDNKLIAFVEEERFRRIKHWCGFPSKSIEYCLNAGNISLSDVDFIAVGLNNPYYMFFKGMLNFYGKGIFLKHRLIEQPGFLFSRLALLAYHRDHTNFFLKNDFKKEQFYWCEHHLSHAASTFRASPFKESNILTMDAWGDSTTAMLGYGKNDDIEVFERIPALNSLGFLYSKFTEYLGYPYGTGHEAKVMGMAAYGKPNKDFSDILTYENGVFNVNSNYAYGKNALSKIEWKFGLRFMSAREIVKRQKDIAATLQRKLEEAAIEVVRGLVERTDSRNLCLAGGVALNCKMNGEILRSGIVDNIFIQPAAGDMGKVLGASLECLRAQGKKGGIEFEHAYWGPEYSNEEIKEALDMYKLKYEYYKDISGHVAEQLAKDKIIAWFQGRLEVGPRALGNRSILADPSSKEVKDRINATIKGREPWRPLCPSVLRKAMKEYFGANIDAPYMILATYVPKEKRKEIEGVIHVDGTARPQSVTRKANKPYYSLIKAYEDITGLPLVLNTSFNFQEPIICSPKEAIKTFYATGLDALAIGNYYLKK